jgi:hypothetical protein
MKQCVVSFVDFGGIRHSVEVQAGSMYEAAAAALESFQAHDCSPGRGSDLEVQVRSAVTHMLSVKKLEDWANVSSASPRDAILKRRIKASLPGAPLPVTRGSERRGRAFNTEQS